MSRPNKSSDDATEIFDAHTHESLGLIGSMEEMSRDRFRRRQGQPSRRSGWRRAQFDELIAANTISSRKTTNPSALLIRVHPPASRRQINLTTSRALLFACPTCQPTPSIG